MSVRRPYDPSRFSMGTTQREAALLFVRNAPELWKDKTVERYDPGQCSIAWNALCEGLKSSGIYSPRCYNWDIRIDQIVRQVEVLSDGNIWIPPIPGFINEEYYQKDLVGGTI